MSWVENLKEFQEVNFQIDENISLLKILQKSKEHEVVRALNYIWKERKSKGFPGTLATSIMRKDLKDVLSLQPHYVLPKSDGIRFMLIFYKLDNNLNTILFDRSMQMFKISLTLKPSMFNQKGSLVEGELIYNQHSKKVEFQIFDILFLFGDNYTNEPYSKRYGLIDTMLSNYRYKDTNPFIMVKKTFFSDKNQWEEFVKNPPYEIDGLILSNSKEPYCEGRSKSILKWKQGIHNTVDFRAVVNSERIIGLEIIDKIGKFQQKARYIKNTRYSIVQYIKLDQEYFKILGISDPIELSDRIVECLWKNSQWNPIRIRDDKSVPNNVETYQLTLQNIKENIKIEEIFDIVFY